MSLLTEIWQILTPRHRRGVLTMQLVSLAMAFSTVTGIAAIAPFFAVLGDPRLIEHSTLLHRLYLLGGFSGTRSFMVALGIAFTAVVLMANLLNIMGLLAMNRLALRIGNELQTTLFGEYLAWPYASHTSTNSTTLFNNVVYETTRVTLGILQHLFTLITNVVTAVLIIGSILLLKPLVALIMFAALTSGYVSIYLLVRNRLLRIGQTQSRFAEEQAQIVTESFGAIKEIIVLQVQKFFRDKFEHASRAFLLAAAQSQIVGQSPRYLMECVAAAGLVGVALALGDREGGVGPQLGSLTFLAFAAYRLLPTLQQVFASIVRIRADRAALAVIGTDLRRAHAAQRATLVGGRAHSSPTWNGRPAREIRLKEVSYRYAPDRPWALRDVSLRIPARSTVGIVGANGSGKSTLVDLVAGLLAPASGVIEVDGCILDGENRAAWQTRLAYVPQNLFLLDSSIAQNIALGVSPADIDRPRLHEAARLAQLDDLVMSLPHRYEQRIGERGVALSGGQRQRIGIARALYRDAAVLLLDEATNALDGLTEQELINTLQRLRGRYSILLIAHRMSSVRACDVIFHLEEGRLIGSGTYDGLLRSSERFRRMSGARSASLATQTNAAPCATKD
jgi:ABC-type multidrug transport system fused ATPase/permease subunit